MKSRYSFENCRTDRQTDRHGFGILIIWKTGGTKKKQKTFKLKVENQELAVDR